jgi:ligand-binding sensor domain-containing protein
VERVLLKALAKEREARFATCDDFLAAWKQALIEAQTVARPAAITPAATQQPRRRPLGWLAAGALLLLVLGAIAVTRLLPGVTPEAVATATGQAAEVAPSNTAAVTGPSGWTSWTAGNSIYAITVVGDNIYTGGPGGVTIWNRNDGSVAGRYTTGDGLPGAQVSSLLVDSNGVLWVGSDNGLARFDGQEWITYDQADGLDSNVITALAQVSGPDGSERLLVGTHYSGGEGGGLNVFDGLSWQAAAGFPSADPDENPAALANFVNVIVQDANGGLWVGTTNGLGFYDGETWTRLTTAEGLPDNEIMALMIDQEGGLIVGTAAGAARLAGDGFEAVAQGPPYGVTGLAQDAQGRYWLAGGGGAWRFDPANANWDEFSQQSGHLPSYNLYGAVQDADGNLYFGSDDEGLIRYDGSDFTTWTVPNAPSRAAFARVLPAPDGALWFIELYGATVDRFDPAGQTWQPDLQLPCSCTPLAFDSNGALWAGEWNNGLWIIDAEGNSEHYLEELGLPAEQQVTAVAFAPDGALAWLGTTAGLRPFDVASRQVVDAFDLTQGEVAGAFIRSLLTASDGSLWVGLDTGLGRLSPGGGWQLFTVGDPFASFLPPVEDMIEDSSGAVWLAARGDGVYRFAAGAWQRFGPETAGVRLPTNEVQSVTIAPDGALWVGTAAGAARFDGNEWRITRVSDGLIQASVNDIYVGEDGAVYFATSGGVTQYRP